MANDRSKFCATCGRERRGLEIQRESWGTHTTALLPRIPGLHPWQITNDLIVSASIYRNGGTSEECHLCDDCLRIGLRTIKLAVDRTLEAVEVGIDKDAELAELTRKLASEQHRCWLLENDLADFKRQQGKPMAAAAGDAGGEILCDNGDRLIVRECDDTDDARCIVIEKHVRRPIERPSLDEVSDLVAEAFGDGPEPGEPSKEMHVPASEVEDLIAALRAVVARPPGEVDE
jgi:hypothetical protein